MILFDLKDAFDSVDRTAQFSNSSRKNAKKVRKFTAIIKLALVRTCNGVRRLSRSSETRRGEYRMSTFVFNFVAADITEIPPRGF